MVIAVIGVMAYSLSDAEAAKEQNYLMMSIDKTSYDIGQKMIYWIGDNSYHSSTPTTLKIYDEQGKLVHTVSPTFNNAYHAGGGIPLHDDWSGPGLYTVKVTQGIHMTYAHFWYNMPVSEQFPLDNPTGTVEVIPPLYRQTQNNPCNS